MGACVDCGQPFTDANVFTAAGWAETKISQMCEACFDEHFGETDLTEEETQDLLMRTIIEDIAAIRLKITHLIDRVKYYKETVSTEDLAELNVSLKKIEDSL